MFKAAVISAGDQLVHQWLGPHTLLARLADKLADVRELDAVYIVGNDTRQIEAAFGLPRTDDRPQHVIVPYSKSIAPEFMLVRQVVELYPPPEEQAVYLFCNPLYPFLDRGRLEDLLTTVLGKAHNAAVLTYPAFVTSRNQATALRPEAVVVTAALAFDLWNARSLDFASASDLTLDLGKVRQVGVDPLETLNIRGKEGQRMAEALVAGGQG